MFLAYLKWSFIGERIISVRTTNLYYLKNSYVHDIHAQKNKIHVYDTYQSMACYQILVGENYSYQIIIHLIVLTKH